MSPVWKLQSTWQADTDRAADKIVLTPHFDDHTSITGPQGLCDDLLAFWDTLTTQTMEMEVAAYDAEGTPPVYPAARAIVNEGMVANTPSPRELAVCLSFYSQVNRPRHRGRLYIPAWLSGFVTSVARPGTTGGNLATIANALANLGGGDVDWVVWSRRDQAARPVTNWWWDNAWDVQRRRGLAPTSRTTGTTSEL